MSDPKSTRSAGAMRPEARTTFEGVSRVFAGPTSATGMVIALVASRFHEPMVERLVEGAAGELAALGAAKDDVHLAWVPGAFELPHASQILARTGRYDAIVALGVVIRGETPHFDYVCREAARGIASVSRDEDVPVLFGVVTADDAAQANARAGGVSNKGAEAARAAVEFVAALRSVK